MDKIILSGEWKAEGENPFTGEKLSLKGRVPGCALNDIVSADVEKCEPFWRDNAERFLKYERYNWHYSKDFEVREIGAHCELVFERLDTYCDVYLNKVQIGSCDNGHISYTFDVDNIPTVGKNTIDVYFRSPVTEVEGKEELTGAFTRERLHTRRIQCTYGWDWVMRFVTCGISGDVYLCRYQENEPRLRGVYVYTKSIDDMGADIAVKVDIDKNSLNRVYTFDILDAEGCKVKSHSKFCSYNEYSFNLSIENAKLWYPVGYGEQPLYELRISCDGKLIRSELFGIRTVRIMQEIDNLGCENYEKCLELKKSSFSKIWDKNIEFSGFTLVVNGKKILCYGANWVPCEPFETGEKKEKITKILTLAKDMGLNMIRVWGGGSFECEHFYNECSRLGIMVTQDFLMACGHYPEEQEWFIKQLNLEAEYAAHLIRNQPCLMWWSGDNENAVDGNDIMEDHWGRRSAALGIHPVLMNLDPERDFLPSSPYGGDFYASNTVGTTHNTQFLGSMFNAIENDSLENYKELYKKLCARFVAEEPCFGAANAYSNSKFLTTEDIYGENDSMLRYHTKGNPGLKKELYDYHQIMTKKILGSFTDGYDRYFKSKYIQYETVRLSLEQLRRERWFCSGIVFWMLNDCWPAALGWSLIDYYCMPKAAYYSFKRCTKPVVCSIDKKGDVYSLYVCNDSGISADVEFKLYAVSGNEKKEICSGYANVALVETVAVHSHLNTEGDVLIGEIYGADIYDRAFYKNGALLMAKGNIKYNIDEEKNMIFVKAKNEYIHAVDIEGNILPEDNYFSLLPGEEKCVKYKKCDEALPLDVKVEAYGLK